MEDEDIHICGKCRLEFNSLNSFVQHKNNCSAKRNKTAVVEVPYSSSAASSSSSSSTTAATTVHATSAEEDAAAALAAAAALSDISAEGLVEEEVEMHMDSMVEQMAEETVETADDGHGEEEDDDEEDEDGESLVAKVIGEEVRLAKQEVAFDGDHNRGSSSHGVQVFLRFFWWF